MKIAVCSDLHLEFGELEIKNTVDADVLVLSGDILVAASLEAKDTVFTAGMRSVQEQSIRYHFFMQAACSEFKDVIYVAGNHEHYHGDFAKTYSRLKEHLAYLPNLHILDKETVVLGDVKFIGSTLWTDMNKEDPMTMRHIRSAMNDFRTVANSNRVVSRKVPIYKMNEEGTEYLRDQYGSFIQDGFKFKESEATFSPEDAVEEHKKCLAYISEVYTNTPPWQTIVVVGHHTPSYKSCHPRYERHDLMNGGYHSDLSEFILDRPAIKLWTHGHTHETFDYEIGECRIVCNPRGYIGYESLANNFKLKVVEV